MNRKQQFLNAVQILAPNDEIILDAARNVREEILPLAPGGAALEFVVAMKRLRAPGPCASSIPAAHQRPACRRRPKPAPNQLSLSYALRVKSAEYWLKLGEPVQALMELDRLPELVKRHPQVLRACLAAACAFRELNQMSVQE